MPPDASVPGADGGAEAAVEAATAEVLYLPDASVEPTLAPTALPVQMPGARCPADMVDVAGSFCIDRFEASLVDSATGRTLSPYYHPTRAQTEAAFEHWQREAARTRDKTSRFVPVPAPEPWQLDESFAPRAVSLPNVVPHGYLSGRVAALACRNAGKRLCNLEEWRTACRGERRSKYPYGTAYRAGACNVHRASHPAGLLHGNPSINHRDPRLNLVEDDQGPLLRRTGANGDCRSQWGSDAAFDMVGNLDEWVDDPNGRFVGGFFSRATQEGCDAEVTSHPPQYYDYSLGVRCCR
jgi:formylglycine-generating enzyme required for sulfatase activity